MKIVRDEVFLCDNCNKNITDKKHIMIHMASGSGWKTPPFFMGGEIVGRRPVTHYCKPECLLEHFTKLLNETDPRKNKTKSPISCTEQVLETSGVSGS